MDNVAMNEKVTLSQKETLEIINRLNSVAKAITEANFKKAQMYSIEDIVAMLERELTKCPHGYVYRKQCATCSVKDSVIARATTK